MKVSNAQKPLSSNLYPKLKIKRKTALLISFSTLVILILAFAGIFIYRQYISTKYPKPTNYKECIKYPGSMVQESYPPTCRTKDGQSFTEKLSPQQTCELAQGNWIDQYSECEGIDQNTCIQSGGSYQDCASPCRHNPLVKSCIELCIKVCKY